MFSTFSETYAILMWHCLVWTCWQYTLKSQLTGSQRLIFVKFNRTIFQLHPSSYWLNVGVWASMYFFYFYDLSQDPVTKNILTNQDKAHLTMLEGLDGGSGIHYSLKIEPIIHLIKILDYLLK